MSMPCHCKTDYRCLALLAPRVEEHYQDLIEFGHSLGWRVYPDLNLIWIELGDSYPLPSIAELVTFLRSVLDPRRLAALKAVWLQNMKTVASQTDKLSRAEPLLSMVEGDSSPLLDILNRRQIETWYQPVFRTKSLELWGFECLLRGRSADGTLIMPVQLIGWARQENLLYMLDRVCRETHLQNAGKALAGNDCHLLVNFMPTVIYNPAFCLQSTLAAIRQGNVDPERVVFEVVETEEITDREHLARVLNYCRDQGFKVALDDVGSGYSGLSLLADLSPDLIKIDRELIAKATTSNLHRDVLTLLVKLGRDNNKLVLAEGVERPEQLELVERLDVDLVQGYLFGRPDPQPRMQPLNASLTTL